MTAINFHYHKKFLCCWWSTQV